MRHFQFRSDCYWTLFNEKPRPRSLFIISQKVRERLSDSVISSLLGLFFSEKYIFFFFWNIKDVKHSTTMHGNHCLMQLCWTQWKYKICSVEHFFKRAFVQKNICSNEYLFQRILVQKNISSNEYLFQRIFVQKGARLICERSKH